MKKVIALASGDWHFFNWPQFNTDKKRLKAASRFFQYITNSAKDLNVPIIFTGDLFHTPQGIDNTTYEFFNPIFRKLDQENKVRIYGISGNHDQSEVNTKTQRSPSLFLGACKAFPNLFKSLEFQSLGIHRINMIGIPYITHNVGYKELVEEARLGIAPGMPNILVIHCDLWGARDPNGREVNTVENIPRNLGKFFKGFDLVLSGHIHKYEKLWDGIYMVGAPYQQRKSDMGCDMGYLAIYDDLSVEFKKYNGPQFRTFDKELGHGDTDDYWMPIVKAKKKEKVEITKFSTTMPKKVLAKKYLVAKGINNKAKAKALIDVLSKVED